jgi:hypothetical protein
MMRALILAGALALATPAWAGNAEGTAADLRQAAYNVCRDVGTSMNICTMKHAASEGEALARAAHVLEVCKSDDPKDYVGGTSTTCPKDRAYIKQRWGY